ncbi:MAG: rhomboid family intramembrane serine protease [Promethearchaeota archaeon]|nr:MAG: rhomboid family intramembrane serine protease [Candidatus Lokiarchaeota archaeon]
MIVLDSKDFENAKITITLIVINVACFIFFQSPLGEGYFIYFVQYNARIIQKLELWRLFTSIFLHGDPMHLFSNVLALLLFGALVEREYSKIQYIAIYFISGILGSIFTLLLFPLETISLGASGAVFGLLGATFVVIATSSPPLVILAMAYIGFFLISSFSPGINIWAHLFGLIGGILFGILFKRGIRENQDYY